MLMRRRLAMAVVQRVLHVLLPVCRWSSAWSTPKAADLMMCGVFACVPAQRFVGPEDEASVRADEGGLALLEWEPKLSLKFDDQGGLTMLEGAHTALLAEPGYGQCYVIHVH